MKTRLTLLALLLSISSLFLLASCVTDNTASAAPTRPVTNAPDRVPSSPPPGSPMSGGYGGGRN